MRARRRWCWVPACSKPIFGWTVLSWSWQVTYILIRKVLWAQSPVGDLIYFETTRWCKFYSIDVLSASASDPCPPQHYHVIESDNIWKRNLIPDEERGKCVGGQESGRAGNAWIRWVVWRRSSWPQEWYSREKTTTWSTSKKLARVRGGYGRSWLETGWNDLD